MKSIVLESIRQLPPLPESAVKIEAIYHEPDSTFHDMVQVLETDPLLTADILKAANSPLYGFSREITSISQVVSLFGMGTIRGFALASIVTKSFDLDLSPYGISNETFATLASTQHALATRWYQQSDPALLEILSPAAFLVEIGKVLIAQCLIEEGEADAFTAGIKDRKDVASQEHKYCETDTPEVSARIFDHWRFDSTLIDVIEHCVAPELSKSPNTKAAQALQVIRTAVPLDCNMTETSISQAKQLIETYGLDMESFETCLEDIQRQLAS